MQAKNGCSFVRGLSRGIGACFAAGLITLLCAAPTAEGYSPHHAFLGGPWELLVKMGLEGQGLHFPIEVDNEDKVQKIDKVLPVLGTPIKITLVEYLPDLTWDTTAVEHAGGGVVASIAVHGPGVEEQIWLDTDDSQKRSISSEVGGVSLMKLASADTIEKLAKKLKSGRAYGILLAQPEGSESSFEYVVDLSKKQTIELPDSKHRLKVLRYLPHYSIDMKTKKVSAGSDKPVNPAIEVQIEDDQGSDKQWYWSKFPSSPHAKKTLPVRITFMDLDLTDSQGRYVIVAVAGAESQIVFSEKGKMRCKKLAFDKPYAFTNKEYSFAVGKLLHGAVLKTNWKNKSENLLHPAIVAVIERDDVKQEAILELNKPHHQKLGSGTLVLMYRRRPEPESK